MTFKYGLSAAALTASLLAAPAAFAGEKSFDLPQAHAVSIAGSGKLTLRIGETQSVVIEASDSDMEKIEVGVDDGRLYIRSKNRGWFSRGPDYKAVVTLKSLDALGFSGAVEADVRGIDADDFEYKTSGASETVLEGRCKTLTIKVSGATELDAKDFICADVKASGSGASELQVHATETLEIHGSGATEVDVYGDPKTRNMKTSGASDVTYHNG